MIVTAHPGSTTRSARKAQRAADGAACSARTGQNGTLLLPVAGAARATVSACATYLQHDTPATVSKRLLLEALQRTQQGARVDTVRQPLQCEWPAHGRPPRSVLVRPWPLSFLNPARRPRPAAPERPWLPPFFIGSNHAKLHLRGTEQKQKKLCVAFLRAGANCHAVRGCAGAAGAVLPAGLRRQWRRCGAMWCACGGGVRGAWGGGGGAGRGWARPARERLVS
jgi:hypothetical protein